MEYLIRINGVTGDTFIFIIDEWDAILRECAQSVDLAVKEMAPLIINDYVNWLRRMFKGGSSIEVFVGAYMTGILPIKKYKTESALNNFQEYSMVTPGALAPFFGFTKEEVRQLADKHGMDFDELEKWYDGYQIRPQPSMFNPNSVMTAIRNEWCDSYWGKTGATDAVASYINMNLSFGSTTKPVSTGFPTTVGTYSCICPQKLFVILPTAVADKYKNMSLQ